MGENAAGPSLQERIAALRSEGTWRFDPLRFRYLESLAQRLQGQQPGVRRLLEQRLQVALAEFIERVAQRQDAARAEAESLLARHPAQAGALRRLQAAGDVISMRRLVAGAQADAACAPLKHLNETIRGATPLAPEEGAAPRELASVRRFRTAWGRSRSQEQLQQALARKPAQAGPLNSHVLVLQALELMGELSPDYLQHFLRHVESLQWLEQAREARSPAKPGKARSARLRRDRK
jgi:hypothetical protein